jgi:tetratricopeptide (TPR) repeat protein
MSGPGALPDPKTATEFAQRGQMYSAIDQHDRALADLGTAIKMEPTSAEFYQNRAKAYRKTGELDLAFADYSKAIELNPRVATYRYSRAAILRTQGALEAAIAEYTAGIGLDPANASAYSSRGTTHTAKGDIDLALADYGKAAELAPERADIQLIYGATRYGSGDFSGAASVLSHPFDDRDRMALYIASFRYLSKRRLGERDATLEVPDKAAGDKKKWPFPIVAFLSGSMTEKDLRSAATTPEQTCEATYYIGQHHVLEGRGAQGQAALAAVISMCPVDYVERIAATAELQRLGAR